MKETILPSAIQTGDHVLISDWDPSRSLVLEVTSVRKSHGRLRIRGNGQGHGPVDITIDDTYETPLYLVHRV